MYEIDDMPTVTKYIKAGELPSGWSRDFPNPKQVVSVTVADVDSVPANQKINLAAPSQSDRDALTAMGSAGQKALYEKAILSASAQPGQQVSKQDIKTAAAKLIRHG